MNLKMKIKTFITLGIALLLGTSLSLNSNSGTQNTNINTNVPMNLNEPSITMRDISEFLKTKPEHYPLSDEFIEKYQQTSGGYIDNARKAGLTVDKRLHEPNQKWHFFESWLYPTIEGGMDWSELAETRVYKNLLCPELLLWIYEACEVNPSKVKEAKEVAELGKASKTHSATLAKNMRSVVSWDDLKPAILSFMTENQNPYQVIVETSNDYEIIGLNSEYKGGQTVTFSINLLNENKAIDYVKMNNDILTAINGEYTFTMPYENANISIVLKDKKPATNVVLDQTSLTMTVGEKNKLLIATITPSDSTDNPIWTIEKGEDIIKLTPNFNEVKINALKEGEATIKVTLNDKISAICSVFVNPRDPAATGEVYSKYNVEYDLGTRTTAKRIETKEDIFAAFVEETNEGVITSISDNNYYIYGGGNGGSGDKRWYSGNMLKMGTTSYDGSLTFALSDEINKVIITGYVHTSACAIQIGDSLSSSWDGTNDGLTKNIELSSMNVASKETISSNSVSSITIDLEATSSLRIDTTTNKPLYITSIEFIYE